MIHDKVIQLTIPHNTGVETLVVHVYVVDGVGVRIAMTGTLEYVLNNAAFNETI